MRQSEQTLHCWQCLWGNGEHTESSLGCSRTWQNWQTSLKAWRCIFPSLVLIGRGPVADRPSIVSFVGVPAVAYPSDWVSVDGIFFKNLVLSCFFWGVVCTLGRTQDYSSPLPCLARNGAPDVRGSNLWRTWWVAFFFSFKVFFEVGREKKTRAVPWLCVCGGGGGVFWRHGSDIMLLAWHPLFFDEAIKKKQPGFLFFFFVIYVGFFFCSRAWFSGCCEVRFPGYRGSFESADSFSSSWTNLIGLDYKTWTTMSWSGSFSARASERSGPSSMPITIQSFEGASRPTRSWLRDWYCLIVRRQKEKRKKRAGQDMKGFL